MKFKYLIAHLDNLTVKKNYNDLDDSTLRISLILTHTAIPNETLSQQDLPYYEFTNATMNENFKDFGIQIQDDHANLRSLTKFRFSES